MASTSAWKRAFFPGFPAIIAPAYDFSPAHHHTAHRHFSHIKGLLSQGQSLLHKHSVFHGQVHPFFFYHITLVKEEHTTVPRKNLPEAVPFTPGRKFGML